MTASTDEVSSPMVDPPVNLEQEEGCWYSTRESRSCRTVHGDDGKPVTECERTLEKIRQCMDR